MEGKQGERTNGGGNRCSVERKGGRERIRRSGEREREGGNQVEVRRDGWRKQKICREAYCAGDTCGKEEYLCETGGEKWEKIH